MPIKLGPLPGGQPPVGRDGGRVSMAGRDGDAADVVAGPDVAGR